MSTRAKRMMPFAYAISLPGFAALVLCMAAGVRWWGFAMCVAEAAGGLAWWSAGRRRPAQIRPRPDYVRITVLEHELLGIAPEPGTAAAASVALTQAFAPRPAEPCLHERTLAVGTLGDPHRTICASCGQPQ